jgi:hypothetical protein
MLLDTAARSLREYRNQDMTDIHRSQSGTRAYRLPDWTSTLILCLLAVPLIVLGVRSPGLDFRAFYVAAQSTASHLDPYADNHQYGEPFSDVDTALGISRWIYPPPALLFVTPLGWLTFSTAKLLFQLFSISALIWMLLFLGRSFELGVVWLALACVSLPVIACVQRGQIDLLILFCLVLAFRLSGRAWAGIPLGVAICIKIFPGALLLWWLLEKKYRETATAMVFVVGMNILAAWRFGLVSYVSFLHNLTSLHSQSTAVLPHLAAPWFSWRSGFVGSYNNPLILFGNTGITVGFLLAVAGILYLHIKKVTPATGFFAATLLSQLMNTALWTMGVVMYLPICLIGMSRIRSKFIAMMFVVPLYFPSQFRILEITPRFVLAIGFISWAVVRTTSSIGSEDGRRRSC